MKASHKPPRWAESLLESFCDPMFREDLVGDLHERFILRTKSLGVFRARLLYLWDVVVFLKPYTVRKDRRYSIFFLMPAYLRYAARCLLKDRLYSFLIVFGLTISMVSFVFVALFVDDELKYDRHYDKAERIYKITSEISSLTASTPVVVTDGHLGQRLKNFAEVEEIVHMVKVPNKTLVRYGEEIFPEDRLYKAERTYSKIFSHDWLTGNPAQALSQPNSIVLTQKLAAKYFKGESPLNKILTVGNRAFTVTGVIADLPPHTDLVFDALLSSEHEYLVETDYWCITFLLSRERLDETSFQKKLNELSQRYLQCEVAGAEAQMFYRIENLPDVHFGTFKLFDTPKSSKNNIYIFSVVAFFIVLIACINYINIAVVKGLKKTAEAGIRKILGASSSQLVIQYLCESFVLCCFSFVLVSIAVCLLFPYFNDITGKHLELQHAFNVRTVSIVAWVIAVLCLLPGFYPATVWSLARITSVRGSTRSQRSMRNGLIVLQFAICVGLMISTKVLYDQWKLLTDSDPGFRREQVLVIDVPKDDSLSLSDITNGFSVLPFVKGVSSVGTNSLPTSSMDIDEYEVMQGGENVTRIFNNITIDEHYIDLLQIEMTQGRNFTAADLSDDMPYVLVNESFVRTMDWKDPINETLYFDSEEYEVIGVVKDFHFNSLHKKLEPIVIHGASGPPEKVMVKVEHADFKSIQILEESWKRTARGPMQFEFLDTYFDNQYKNERTTQRVLLHFSILTLVIACLGLSGVVALSTARKSKEYAIRKVLGAKFWNIVYSIGKEFTMLIIMGVCLAVPVALIVTSHWLQQFSYRTEVGLTDCIGAILVAVGMALVSMTYFAVRAALDNPVGPIKTVE